MTDTTDPADTINTITAWIQDRQSIQAKATEGPWKLSDSGWSGDSGKPDSITAGENETVIHQQDEQGGSSWENENDATAIVDARNELPKTLTALTTILNLHTPVTEYGPDYFTGQYPCEECNRSDQEGLHPTTWPCPTIQAIQQATTEKPTHETPKQDN